MFAVPRAIHTGRHFKHEHSLDEHSFTTTMSTTVPAPKQWILGDKFNQVYPHLASLQALWETKWKIPCKLSVYPFHHGKFEDFEPIFDKLIADGIKTAYVDEYTKAFIPTAEKLAEEAERCEKEGDKEKAIDLYERAACVLRISRFPSKDASEFKKEVFGRQKEVYLKGAALWEEPLVEVKIEHTAGVEEDEGREVPLLVRLPKGVEEGGERKCPVVLLITGESTHAKRYGDMDVLMSGRAGWA